MTMFENILTLNNVAPRRKIAYKTILSAGLVVLAVVLPQLIHIVSGQPGGAKWLPMYLPVLICGCMLGTKWGIAVGVLSPLTSFLITSLAGSPMPALQRLPFMMIELAVFAAVSGAFTKKISENGAWAFAAVISAQLIGRCVFLGSAALFGESAGLPLGMVWSQIRTGFVGLAVQAVLVPVIIIALKKIMEKKSDE